MTFNVNVRYFLPRQRHYDADGKQIESSLTPDLTNFGTSLKASFRAKDTVC